MITVHVLLEIGIGRSDWRAKLNHLEAAGPRSITTTARYLDHIAPYAVVEAIGKRAW